MSFERLTALLLCVFVLAACSAAIAENVNLRLGPEGEVLAWLAVGPFPNPGTEKFTCRGFDTDIFPGGESSALGVEGTKVASTRGMLTWKLAIADPRYGISFTSLFGDTGPAVAYAYACVVSNADTDARLLLGSDDGVKVWVNGFLIHSTHETRGVERDKDKVEIRLNSGHNDLLFKVDQHFGGWGLLARIVDREGKPIPGLVETLHILSNSSDKSDVGLVRSMAGKPGSLDLNAALVLKEWMRRGEAWMPWFARNPGGATALKSEIRSHQRMMYRARRQNADEISDALARAVSSINKAYDGTWAALSARIQNPEPLMKADPTEEDYVRVAPGGRYFVHADGRFYTPIGYNHNPEWTDFTLSGPANPGYDPQVTERFFKMLRDSGVNLVRMMIENPLSGILERPVGTFLPEQVAWLDNLVIIARKYDVKLMITPWDTFWMGHLWKDNPYNIANGGMVDRKVDFLTKPEAIESQKKRWKFIIDRWGNTGTIFAWELLNESDYWWESTPEQLIAWTKEMGDFVRSYEKERWGRNHLICISTGRPMPDGGWGDLAYRQPGMDLAQTHLYIGAANAPEEPIGPAFAEKEGVTYAMAQIKDARPYIDGENGPINKWIADEKLDDEVFHNMSWAHMASGGAGSGLRWPYRGPHHLTAGMYRYLSVMRAFADRVPWAKLIGERVDVKASAPDGWVSCAIGTSDGALVWVAGEKQGLDTIEITWPGAPKTVKYTCYDTRTGEWFAKGATAPKDDVLTLTAGGERRSVAVILE